MYLLGWCLDTLRTAPGIAASEVELLYVLPHEWEEGTPLGFVYRTDEMGDLGSFRLLPHGDWLSARLQCMACGTVVGRVKDAQWHVLGSADDDAMSHMYVYGTKYQSLRDIQQCLDRYL